MKSKDQNLLQPLRGFRDFLPQDALKRQWLRNRLSQIFAQWGFDPLETPTLEAVDIFEGQIGEGESMFFKFEDQGGRKVALRYDQSVPTARVVARFANQLPFPFRRYQIQSAYRAEKPQKGRYREFVQCDADIFGTSSPYADAETIALSIDIYRQLGFKQTTVLISDRELLKDLPYEAIVAIDKLKKIGDSGVIDDMVSKSIPRSQAQKYLDFTKQIKPNQTIDTILNYLKGLGFDPSWYKFEATLARSFSYSSGPIWEVEIPGFVGGSVLGGERFDKVIKNISGLDIPATGFGLGFDRTLEALEQFNLIPTLTTNSKVLVTIFSPELQSKALEIASTLREAGVNTELYPDPDVKLGKQFKYASVKGIPYVIVLGPDEIKNKTVTLKNLPTGEQQTIPTEQLVEQLN